MYLEIFAQHFLIAEFCIICCQLLDREYRLSYVLFHLQCGCDIFIQSRQRRNALCSVSAAQFMRQQDSVFLFNFPSL